MLGSVWRRIVSLFSRERLTTDLDEEIREHYLALRAALEADGHAPHDAARLARLRFGGVLQIREQSHDEWHLAWLEALARDVRLSLRTLRRNPGFFLASAATLALGTGAATAIFSVAYGVSLRPLDYPNPDRLLRIYEANPATGQPEHDVSVGAFDEWRKDARSLEGIALFAKSSTRTVAGEAGHRVITMSVSPAFFDVLGVSLIRGGGFKPEHEYTRFTTDDVVLSYGAWQRLLAGRSDPIGATISLAGVGDDDPYTVVGVLPEDFAFIEPADLFVPEVMEPAFAPKLRGWRYDRVIGRLKPGATIEQTRAELTATAERLARETPTASAGWTVTVKPLHEAVIGGFGRAAWLMFAAVVVVLLVACLNVAGLFVARAVSRDRETALRVSLGAGPWRVIQLRLVEAGLICAVGGSVGLLLASFGVSALKAAAPPGIPRLEAVALDGPTLAMTLIATTMAALIFGVGMPGAARRAPTHDLRAHSGISSDRPGRQITRVALMAAQCAGAAALVVLGVMLTRSFDRLTAQNLGWQADGVLSLQSVPRTPKENRRPWFARIVWSDQVISTLESTPGVQAAALTTQMPFAPTPFQAALARGRGQDANDPARWSALAHKVTDRYFELMGIRIISGRGFNRDDRYTEPQMTQSELRPDRGVAMVTRQTAETLWPGQPAIGQAVRLPNDDNVKWREVVGVTADIQFGAVGESPGLHVFVPWTQDSASARVFVLTKAAPDTAAPTALRDIVRSVAPGADVDHIASLPSQTARATAQPRFTSRVVAAFGVLALALAAVGIYGTLSYVVSSRTREIGVRVAMGATTRRVYTDVLRRGMLPAIGGVIVGLAVALALARTFRALLFAIEPLDAASFATGAAALIGVALIAALGPARRAARVDPVRALRAE